MGSRYAILTIMINEGANSRSSGNADAKLWGKGADGTDLYVTITASGGDGMAMDELMHLSASLGLRPED